MLPLKYINMYLIYLSVVKAEIFSESCGDVGRVCALIKNQLFQYLILVPGLTSSTMRLERRGARLP